MSNMTWENQACCWKLWKKYHWHLRFIKTEAMIWKIIINFQTLAFSSSFEMHFHIVPRLNTVFQWKHYFPVFNCFTVLLPGPCSSFSWPCEYSPSSAGAAAIIIIGETLKSSISSIFSNSSLLEKNNDKT